MSLGDGGLDAQVEQRMDAYRGNPQQLQKRYGQSKELLDLMALQKLKTEKEQIAADMQLKAQQNPNTIAEQREQEALELVKQEQAGTLGELTKGVGDTLAQKQKMQTSGMKKMAQGAGKPKMGGGAGLAGLMGGQQPRPPMPPQPRGPQAAGLPNARMMQAARGGPVRRMANGGIVGFSGGEEIKAETQNLREQGAGSQVKNEILKLGLTVEAFAALQPEQRKRIVDTINDKAMLGRAGANAFKLPNMLSDLLVNNPLKALGNLGISVAESRVGRALGVTDAQDAPIDRFEYNSGLKNLMADQLSYSAGDPSMLEKVAGTSPDLTGEGFKSLLPRAENPETQDSGTPLFTGYRGIQELMPPKPAVEPVVEPVVKPPVVKPPVEQKTVPPFVASDGSNAPVINAPETSVPMVGGEDPMAQMQEGFAAANLETGRAEKAAEFDSMLKELKAFDAENYDPERERSDRLKAFLLGGAGKTNIGATFAGAGTASMNLGSSQRKERRGRLIDKFNMQKSKMATDTALAQTSVQLGRELFTQAAQDNRMAMQVASQMRGQDLTRLQENARNKLETMKNEDANSYRQQTIALDEIKQIQKTMNDASARKNERINAANQTIARTLVAREYFAEEAKRKVNLDGLALQLENASLTGLEGDELKALQNAYDLAAARALVEAESMMNMFGRGGTADNPTGVSMLDTEQQALQVLAELQQLTEDDIQSVSTTGN
tara:strand:- start:30 stop:2192 length:2163 start_codon:yes stop_codon:yes gene_type:complete